MPMVFKKDCKMTVIEYGGIQSGLMSLEDIHQHVSKVLNKVLKK